MNAIALREPVSKLKGPFTDCTLPGKTFIWLPFAGGMSSFRGHPAEAHGNRPWGRWRLSGRVPRERMLRRDARWKNCQQFRFFMSDPALIRDGYNFQSSLCVSNCQRAHTFAGI
jgi:hypothetical protein